ncbi:MAG TPA: efflux RND transporter periplasmic adaptor subunit [Rhizomicrobium sp.]|nr:efflux RND transporter periplasmic adaptor subunit [Rhizomicrobium sp.]
MGAQDVHDQDVHERYGRPQRPHRVGSVVILMTAAIIVAIGVWLLVSGKASGAKPAAADMSPNAIRVSGTLNPISTVMVGTVISGVIREVLCDENMPVKMGQVCARIDPRPFQTTVDEDAASVLTAMAQLEKDEANLAYAETVARRYHALVAQNAVSKDQLDNLASTAAQDNAQVDLDKALVAQRRATLEEANVYLEYTNIVSPIDGVVLSRHATVGETIASQFQTPTLFVIASNLSKMQLDATVSEKEINRIRVGDRVTYFPQSLPDQEFDGVVRGISLAPRHDGNGVSYTIAISADNSRGLFRPGMMAITKIQLRN